MSLDFIAEVWDILRNHIDSNERSDAADSLVNFLIDNNYETDDIKESFGRDKAILNALKTYIAEHEVLDEFEDEYDEDDDEW